MAASAITVQTVDTVGEVITFAAANVDGNYFTNDGLTYLHIKNGGASPITVTVNSLENCSYGFDHNLSITIANGAEKVIGFFSKKRFNAVDGTVGITYSAVTTVTVAAVKVTA